MKNYFIMSLALCCLFLSSGQYGRSDVARYAELDRSVRSMPKPSSMEDLAKALMTAAKNDDEKIRAAWIWITANISYDTQAFFSGVYPSTGAANVFSTGKSVCQGYSNLFSDILTAMGVKDVHSVSGYAKGYGYRMGKRFVRTNHAWNAVFIDGRWRLYDVTWGSGHLEGRSFVRQYKEYWFDVNPELFRITHLPEDSKFQKCSDTIDLERFQNQQYIHSHTITSLLELGFSPDDIISKYRNGVAMVKAYDTHNTSVKIITAPLQADLASGTGYSFVISAPTVEKIALLNNNEWNFMEKKENDFSMTITPKAGVLSLNIQYPRNGRTGYWEVLHYRVKHGKQ